jgi:hypothetical protein
MRALTPHAAPELRALIALRIRRRHPTANFLGWKRPGQSWRHPLVRVGRATRANIGERLAHGATRARDRAPATLIIERQRTVRGARLARCRPRRRDETTDTSTAGQEASRRSHWHWRSSTSRPSCTGSRASASRTRRIRPPSGASSQICAPLTGGVSQLHQETCFTAWSADAAVRASPT